MKLKLILCLAIAVITTISCSGKQKPSGSSLDKRNKADIQ